MDEGERFMWWTALLIVIALLFTLSLTSSQYTHGDIAEECRPNIYPICFRATDPAPLAPASPVAVFFSLAGTGVLAVILLYAAYHASVMKQANLIVATADIKKTEVKTPSPVETKPVITPSPIETPIVAKPSAKPKKGIDLGLVS